MNNGQYKTCLEKYGCKHPAQNKDVLEKMKQTNIKIYGVDYYTKTKEYKERIRTYWKNLTDEEISNLFKNRLHKFKAPNGKIYDSSWKYKFEQYLIANNIKYEYQSSTKFKWVDVNGKERTYIPDFKIIKENKEEIIEIKGDYFFDKDGNFINPYNKIKEGYTNAKLKWECMIKNHVRILTSKELISLGIDLS